MGALNTLRGLVTRGGTPVWPWMLGQVVGVGWAELQAGPGEPITPNNPIDQTLAAIAKYNASQPAGFVRQLRVRLHMGSMPAGWFHQLAGNPIKVLDPASGVAGFVGRYWNVAFQNAYAELQRLLAAKYDGEITDITLASASLIYTEPLRKYSIPELQAAGSTVLNEIGAFHAMIAAHTVWEHTGQTLSLNPASYPGLPAYFAEQQIANFRTTKPKLSVLMNNSLRSTSLGPQYDALFTAMRAAGGRISFQTATGARVGSLSATLALAVGLGACSVELPGMYAGLISETAAGIYQSQLLDNCSRVV